MSRRTPGPAREDLSGQIFGWMRVLHLDHVASGHGYWLCECLRPDGQGQPCGRRKPARDTKLRSGRIVSCGCSRADVETRRTARMKVPARLRKRIARAAAQVSAAVRRGK